MFSTYPSRRITHSDRIQSYYDICGNAPIEQAEVIIVTDDYNNQKNAKNNVDLVNQIWQGHLVLVEDIPFGQKIMPEEHRFSQGIDKNIPIYGWDHPQFKKRTDSLDIKEGKINVLAQHVLTDLQEGDLGLFLKESGSFDLFLGYSSESTKQKKKEIRQYVMNGKLDVLALSVNQVIKDVKREHQMFVYELYANLWQIRLGYLMEAIEKGVDANKKVIVLASGSFVIPNPKLKAEEFKLAKIGDYLRKKKFVIINAKQSPLVIVNQPELWSQPQKKSSSSDSDIGSCKIIAPKPKRVVVMSHWFISKREDSVENAPTQLDPINGLLEERSHSLLSAVKQELTMMLKEKDSNSTFPTEENDLELNLGKSKEIRNK